MDNEKGKDTDNVIDATDAGITGNRNDIVKAILKSVGNNK